MDVLKVELQKVENEVLQVALKEELKKLLSSFSRRFRLRSRRIYKLL
jgi:hypothetical protein